MNARTLAAEAAGRLAAAGVPEAVFEGELLVRHTAGLSRAAFFTSPEIEPPAALELALARREAREPAAYITGTREFYGLAFHVGPGALIPRPETEMLVDVALADARAGDVIVDVGTGSGAVAVATALVLAERFPPTVLGIDISEAALSIAAANVAAHRAPAALVRGDLGAAVKRADIILANLPYIPSGEIDDLEPEVSRWEPRVALDGGADGFALIRRLVSDCAARLQPRLLALEVGFGQAAAVASICRAAGAATQLQKDLAGIDRIVVARWA